MEQYNATVTRDGALWLIEVEGIGATQAETWDEIPVMAADVIAAMTDEPADSFDLLVTLHGALPV
ncbi:hypothetical protein [Nocardioides sp. R-C-SC26]|uniref:hypothetical protein n=1 Tax=Nocardioides sp. R-C-SC26 TaxID=2870414 RepID=UPI001E569623|nr:hypothetical protein [Nocardioides sp. R-C-SC26]